MAETGPLPHSLSFAGVRPHSRLTSSFGLDFSGSWPEVVIISPVYLIHEVGSGYSLFIVYEVSNKIPWKTTMTKKLDYAESCQKCPCETK